MSSKIAIRPYTDGTDNMGLQKYKQVVFEGVSHKVSMWAREDVSGSGNFRFITGLNEFAPELNLLDDEDKEAKVKQIRATVAMLEGTLASNKLDVKDKNFWDKVIVCKPNNTEFWGKISVIPSNNDVYLDKNDPEDIIKIASIEAGGFPEIAPSLEAAKSGQKKFKFYLDKFEESIKESTKTGILESRANAVLIDLYDTNVNKLLLLCKALDPNSPQYKKSTPNEVLFGNMDEYIKGIVPGTTRRSVGNAKNFVEVAALDMETLKLRALVKDASFYGFLVIRQGQIFEAGNETAMGYSVVDVVEFLKNPLNDAILSRLLKRIEQYWNA